jgi:hypothetical protein
VNKNVVKNASDKRQVDYVAKNERREDRVYSEDLEYILKTPQGRNVLWRLMGDCNIFKTAWSNDGKLIHKNIGKQELGQKLLADITAVDEKYFFQMMKENYKGNGELDDIAR